MGIGEKEIAKPDICRKIILDMDANGDGLMDREEFIKMIMIFFLAKEKFLTFYNKDHIKNTEEKAKKEEEEKKGDEEEGHKVDDDAEEEESMPDELANLSPEEQQKRLL